MANFKSDKIDIDLFSYSNLYANIPTGALVPIAGAVSSYTNSPLIDLGLLPCNGGEWSISTYQNLYNLITQNGTAFPFGANTNGSGAAGSTHFVLPNMLTTKYFLVGTASNISVANAVGHGHSGLSSLASLEANATAWNHYHDFSASSDNNSMNAHNHNYPSLNATSASNGNSVVSKNDATTPTAASPSHSHGSFNMNAGSSNNQNAGAHSHSGNTASSNATDLGSHTHSANGTATYSTGNSVAIYPSFQNFLYFIKA